MKIGYALSGDVEPAIIREVGAVVEQLEYDSFWVNYPRSRPSDGLAALADAVEPTHSIPIGLGVVPLNLRTADEVVKYLEASELPLDRLWIGVGSGSIIKGALATVRDAVSTIREHLGCRVVVAALGQRMCELGGEVADDVLFNFVTADSAARCSEWVQAGAAAAGRPTPCRHAYVRVATGATAAQRVEDEARRHFAGHSRHYESVGATPLGAAVIANQGDDITAQLQQWLPSLDSVVFKPLPEAETADSYIELARLGATVLGREMETSAGGHGGGQ